jgi:hypothetical protein
MNNTSLMVATQIMKMPGEARFFWKTINEDENSKITFFQGLAWIFGTVCRAEPEPDR